VSFVDFQVLLQHVNRLLRYRTYPCPVHFMEYTPICSHVYGHIHLSLSCCKRPNCHVIALFRTTLAGSTFASMEVPPGSRSYTLKPDNINSMFNLLHQMFQFPARALRISRCATIFAVDARLLDKCQNGQIVSAYPVLTERRNIDQSS
jgi:hypothetical protein